MHAQLSMDCINTNHKQMPFNLSLWNSGLNDCAAIYTNTDMFANKNVMFCINISEIAPAKRNPCICGSGDTRAFIDVLFESILFG